MLIKLRFHLPDILLGILLATALFALGATFWSSKYPPSQPDSSTKTSDSRNQQKQQDGWWERARDPIAVFTFCLVAVGAIQIGFFYRQLDLIRKSLAPAEKAANAAQDAANAANANAQAVIDAERAHLYVIIKNETVDSTFASARMYDKSPSMHPNKMTGPGIQYVLRNYGKTPAILQHIWHGISIQTAPTEMRTLVAGEGALQVIGVNTDAPIETVTYTEPFTFGDARALVTEDKVLYFFGQADYSDAFGGHIKLEWEFIADQGMLRQIQHKETRQPQEQRSSSPAPLRTLGPDT
jgi:hypothetical protein